MKRRIRSLIVLTLLTVLPLLHWQVAAQSDTPASTVQVTVEDDTVHLEWTDGDIGSPSPTLAAALPDLPLVDIGGKQIPAHLIALRSTTTTPTVPAIGQVSDVAWQGSDFADATPPVQLLAGEEVQPFLYSSDQTWPTAPVFVLRQGQMRGEQVTVAAVSPIYEQAGELRRATQVQASFPGSTPLTSDTTTARALLDQFQASGPFLSAAPAPTNPVANNPATPAFKVTVAAAGMQQISGAMLAAQGIDLNTLNPDHLHVWYAGQEIAIELFGTTDRRLDAGDGLRFYAPAPGDRWNATSTYWLTIAAAPGRRMPVLNAAPGAGTPRTSALEPGAWYNPTRYESRYAGPDGDHWFSTRLNNESGSTTTQNVPLALRMPSASGTATFTIGGSARTSGEHQLRASIAGQQQTFTWNGNGDWSHTATLNVTASSQPVLKLTLLAGSEPSDLLIDSVTWDYPVSLNAGQRGVQFTETAGTQPHQLTNVAAGSALYRVTDPTTPVRLVGIGTSGTLQFKRATPPADYLLAGTGTLHTPTIAAHRPASLQAALNADVLYIAPAEFHAGLAPLVARRQAQGYTVAVVAVQALYDHWSYGQVSPEAIRSFLRYAASTGARAPLAVTLVGNGTVDPLDHSAMGDEEWPVYYLRTPRINTNFVPPYMAMVDVWLGETACDTCYARLDSDNPLDDPLTDLLIGRLPVKSEAELTTVVAKIVGYETLTGGIDWRTRATFIADNYIHPDTGVRDPAGDFAAFADNSAALQPAGVDIERVYYDPSPTAGVAAWREADASEVRARTVAALNRGAGTVMYAGHSYYINWGTTSYSVNYPHLLWISDTDDLSNGERLPVVLTMTCLTSAFQVYEGSTIDERILLHPNGGAVAVWGSSGLGVAYGHNALQRGFYNDMWNGASGTAATRGTVGQRVQAGYLDLYTNGNCCQSSLYTFVLLGDPLTQMRATATRAYLPTVYR